MDTIIVGRKPVLEALNAGRILSKIILLQGVKGPVIDEIASAAARAHIPVSTMTKQEFRGLTTEETTQGVVALTVQRRTASLEDMLAAAAARGEKGFLLMLDEIEDPQNLGALIRTAECCGVHGVILPKHHSAPVSAAAVKASAGATEHMPITEVTNLVTTIDELKEQGFWIVGLDMDGQKTYHELQYTTPTVVVVGSEGRGIRRLVREHCDFVVRIPVFGKISSLNASVAGAVVMYEVARSRGRLDQH